MPEIIWTSYLSYRSAQRGFDLDLIENILRFSSERYFDILPALESGGFLRLTT
jgi:hypothetical protein